MSAYVLIAGYSGRALAQSARRAGFKPLVADCFGDLDTMAATESHRLLQGGLERGLSPGPLVAALDALAGEAGERPIGLVVTAGFEGADELLADLDRRYTLIGCSPDAARRAKDPTELMEVLKHAGIRHPETSLERPSDVTGWLAKRAGGSGGAHVVPAEALPVGASGYYFQRLVQGPSLGALIAAGAGGTAFAFSHQWTSPSDGARYRYGGAVMGFDLDPALEAELIDISLVLERELGLRGLVSIDFMLSEGGPLVVDVNPRPGATIDIFDDEEGSLFKAHLEGARGGDPAGLLSENWRPAQAKAAAVLYADRGAVVAPPIAWPPWVMDRPRPGTTLSEGSPLATVVAEAQNPAEAERLCRERLGRLEELLYEDRK